jgi:hypothetical protein
MADCSSFLKSIDGTHRRGSLYHACAEDFSLLVCRTINVRIAVAEGHAQEHLNSVREETAWKGMAENA